MAFAVGVDFGSAKTTVAITKWDNESGSAPERCRVATVVPSVVFLGEHHEFFVGDEAQKLGAADPHRVIRDFKRRLGDSVPIIADDWRESTESVIAALVRRVVDDVADQQNAAPEAVALAYPAHWGPYKKALLAGALRDTGLTDVLLVTEPDAAITNAVLPSNGRSDTVLVYDLGAGSFDAAVMTRPADGGAFDIVGIPQGLDWLGGDDFDQAIFSLVRQSARLGAVDVTDTEVLTQMSRLREACTHAKESLSLDTEVAIPVTTPRFRTRIRLVRAEFEDLIRDAVEDTLDATRRVISSAGLTVADVDAIVLVGGSSRIPLVAQMISAEFSLPIIVDAGPEASISQGAALLAANSVRTQTVLQAAVATAPVATAPAPAIAPDLPAPMPAPDIALPPTGQSPLGGRRPVDQEPLPGDGPPRNPGERIDPPTVRPDETGAEPPAARDNGADRGGRHRHRGRHRYGWRTAGLVAAVSVLILGGSSLAASQAADVEIPTSRSQSVEPAKNPVNVPDPTGDEAADPAGDAAAAVLPAAPAPSAAPVDPVPVAAGSMDAEQLTGASVSTSPTVNAPAVVVDLSELGGSDDSR